MLMLTVSIENGYRTMQVFTDFKTLNGKCNKELVAGKYNCKK